jgi:hypothetical protein
VHTFARALFDDGETWYPCTITARDGLPEGDK